MAYETARKLQQEDEKWFYPCKSELPEDNTKVYAIYMKRRVEGLVYGDSKFYYLGGQWEFNGSGTVLFDENIIAWQPVKE